MSTSTRPLLIVDDDAGLLRQLRWAFSEHKVYPASTRQEATDLVRRDPVPLDSPPIPTEPQRGWQSWPTPCRSHRRPSSSPPMVTKPANTHCGPSPAPPPLSTK